MADKERLTVQEDTTYRAFWPLFDDDGVTPLDVAGWTARSEIRDSEGLVLEEFEVSLDDGRVELMLEADERTWVSGVFDIRLVAPDGDVSRPVQGSVKNVKSVTR